jgi:hypothetical protein
VCCGTFGLCRRRNRQSYTGSTFEAVIVYPSASVTVQGDFKTYNDIGDSGKTLYRRYCPNCDSMAEANVMPGLTIVLAGTLNDQRPTPLRWKSTAAAPSPGSMWTWSESAFPKCQGDHL